MDFSLSHPSPFLLSPKPFSAFRRGPHDAHRSSSNLRPDPFSEIEDWEPFAWKHNALRHSFISCRLAAVPDTGERAFDNVRKAVRVVTVQLRKGNPEERAFAEHLQTHLSIGFECLYSQPLGRIWA